MQKNSFKTYIFWKMENRLTSVRFKLVLKSFYSYETISKNIVSFYNIN